jgi:hypothetical protein
MVIGARGVRGLLAPVAPSIARASEPADPTTLVSNPVLSAPAHCHAAERIRLAQSDRLIQLNDAKLREFELHV